MITTARCLSSTALVLTLAVTGPAPSVAGEHPPAPAPSVSLTGPVLAPTPGPSAAPGPDFWCRIFRCGP